MVLAACAVAVVLVASLARAAFGPPPAQPDPLASAGWLIAGLLFLALALAEAGAQPWGFVMNGAAVIALAVAGWWMRAPREDGGDEPGPEPAEPEPGPDWNDFDRLRAGWDRPRVPTRF